MDRYVDALLAEPVPEKAKDNREFAWQRTPFAIGNFLRGWIINVPANREYAKNAEIPSGGILNNQGKAGR